jgi:membrane protease YdiL (CAAX protease family)
MFSLLFCMPVFVALLTISLVLAELLRKSAGWGTNGGYVGSSIGLVLGAAVLILLLQRFEWLDVAGFRLPTREAWLLIVPAMLWIVSANFYVSSGTFDVNFSDPLTSSLLTLRMLSTGLFEETAFRGVILTTMLMAWGQTRRGVWKSFLLSSLLFGLLHLLNLGARETIAVVANSIYTCFTGALFAGIAMRCRSIWPAVLLHGLSNALLSLNRLGEPSPEWTADYAVVRILVHIPLGLYGLLLIRGLNFESVPGIARESD